MNKNTIKKTMLLSSLLLSLGATRSFSQAVSDITGKNYRIKLPTEVTGTPYFSDDFAKGIIKLKSGKIINGLNLKYYLMDDLVLYKDSRDSIMEVAEPIAEFKLESTTPETKYHLFRSGFNKSNGNTENSFYEILSDGNVKFIKKDVKYTKEFSEYNSKTTVKSIEDKITYYVVKADNTPIIINKTEKSILNALGNKQTELSDFIRVKKLNLKRDGDILKVFEYYQSLN